MVTLAMLALAATTASGSWASLGPDRTLARWSYNKANVQVDGANRVVEVRRDATGVVEGGVTVRDTVTVINCAKRLAMNVAMVGYDGSGKAVESGRLRDQPAPILPGTTMDTLAQAVCAAR